MGKYRKQRYEAMGFVEALIAIMIAGIASVVLMQIAASALKEAVQNERMDKMTQYAVETGSITRTIVENTDFAEHYLGNEEDQMMKCYIPVSSDGGKTWSFFQRGEEYVSKPWMFMVQSTGVRGTMYVPRNPNITENIEAAIKDENGKDTEYFRYSCMVKQGSGDNSYVRVRIYISHIPSTGKITNEKEIRDYEYITTINL